MHRIHEEKGGNTIQAWRQHEASEFYKDAQRKKDQAWIELTAQQLRHKANSDIVV